MLLDEDLYHHHVPAGGHVQASAGCRWMKIRGFGPKTHRKSAAKLPISVSVLQLSFLYHTFRYYTWYSIDGTAPELAGFQPSMGIGGQ